MKTALRLLALVVALAGAIFWAGSGANRGWTKTSVAVKSIEEATGLEEIRYESRFVPGLDFLGGAVLGASLLGGASFLFRQRVQTSQTKP